MKVRVLGCSGAIAQGCRTTAFLIDADTLVDAGTGVGDLRIEEMLAIEHVLLTHAHLDHVAALPLMLDAVAAKRLAAGAPPLRVHALAGTIAALRAHIFNDVIWPDFARIPSDRSPLIRFEPFEVGERVQLPGKCVEILPAVHTVPAVGFAIAREPDAPHWVFSGDTGRNPAFWQRVNQLPVAQLVIETAFSNREAELARKSQHLAPVLLAEELRHIAPGRVYPIHITHTKPAETQQIADEIAGSDLGSRDVRWLNAGQEFHF